VLGAAQCQEIVRTVDRLDELEDCSELLALLTSTEKRRAAA
jgi:hypothetical protein